MKVGITWTEIEGQFESVMANEEKIADLKAQEKALNEDSKEIFKSAADEFDMKTSDLKESYKYWKKVKETGEPANEDVVTIMAMIDSECVNSNSGEEA